MESEGAAAIPQLVESLKQAPTTQAPSAPAGQRDSNSNVHSTHSHKGPVCEKTRKDLFTDTFCKVCGAVLLYESQRISHYEGKKHAQKVHVYFQMYNEQEPEEVPDKPKVESMNFQMDGNEVSDKNKFCSLCNMVFSSAVVAQSHYVGKIHAKKLKLANGESTLNWPPVVPSTPPRGVEKETGTNASAEASDSSDQPKQDVKIDLHSLTEINTEDPDKYCKLCCAQFNNPLMAQQHYIGKRHGRNKHRKRMMEEMEDEGVISDCSTSAVGVGTYVCPVCSVTFVSIEMYQSHIQGTKHHVKENIVVSVLKNTKKSYDSFQDELADYIKVQKARGLEPKTNIRKPGDCNDSDDYDEGKDERAPPGGFVHERIPTFDRARSYPQSCSRPSRSRLPYRTPAQRNYYRGRLMQHGPLRPKYYPEPERKLPAAFKLDTGGHKRVRPNDNEHYTSSDDSSDSYHKERRHKRKRRKEKRHKESTKLKKHHRPASKKRRKSSDDTDSEMEDLKLKPKEEVVESTHEDNVTQKEEKKCEAQLPAEKEIKKHKRAKKKKDIDPRTEEEKLWDESILGF